MITLSGFNCITVYQLVSMKHFCTPKIDWFVIWLYKQVIIPHQGQVLENEIDTFFWSAERKRKKMCVRHFFALLQILFCHLCFVNKIYPDSRNYVGIPMWSNCFQESVFSYYCDSITSRSSIDPVFIQCDLSMIHFFNQSYLFWRIPFRY